METAKIHDAIDAQGASSIAYIVGLHAGDISADDEP